MNKIFIEIGSCDFDTNLPLIIKGGWKGIMCEPSPQYFNNLSNQAKDIENRENLFLENIAISDYDGKIKFGCVKDMGKPGTINGWIRGISSVLADNHKGERMFDIDKNKPLLEKVIDVQCMTLDSLIDKYGYTYITYLKIDTEGHELNILESYSWNIKPLIIKVEHSHINDIYAREFLESKGYLVYTEATNLYGVL